MKHVLIRITLYSLIAMVPVACGTRKSEVDIRKEKSSEKSSEVVSDKTSNIERDTSTSTEKEAITEYVKEGKTTVTTKYDVVTGNVLERTKTTESIDKNRTENRERVITRIVDKVVVHDIYRNIDKHITHTTFDKQKTTTRRNDGWYYVAGFGLLLYFIYKWVRN